MHELAIAVVLLGLLFDYTNGFHDAANVVSTVIATRVLKPISAIAMAAILNTIGATQISGVAQTIASGLVQMDATHGIVVLSTLFGAIVWNLGTWYWRIPSSSSYALIGGLIGASWAHKGWEVILWGPMLKKVILPMIFSPVIGFTIGLFVMKGLYVCLGKRPHLKNKSIFKHLQIGSSGVVALAHGLNDAQKSMGIITMGLYTAGYLSSIQIPLWVILSCALTIGLGTAFGGFRIIDTMGFKITKIEPMQGFAAECSASCVILGASFLGMPISSTHMIAGSITGVGRAQSADAVDWKVPQKMILALLLTLPGAGIVGAAIYELTRFF